MRPVGSFPKVSSIDGRRRACAHLRRAARANFRASSALAQFGDEDFAREALEEHFVVSSIVQAKAMWVSVSDGLTLFGIELAGVALLVKTVVG